MFNLSGSSSSSSDSAFPEFLIDLESETSESNTTNIFDFATQNESESHGIQINPTEYPKTTTDVYQINMKYSDRSTDVMRYESYRMIKKPSSGSQKLFFKSIGTGDKNAWFGHWYACKFRFWFII